MGDWSRRDLLKAGGLVITSGIASNVLAHGEVNLVGQAENAITPPHSSHLPERKRTSLDFGWRFHLGHASEPSKDFGYSGQSLFSKTGGMFEPSTPDFDDQKWMAIDVPHDWAVELDFVNDPALESHGYKPLGRDYPATSIGWYRRVFEVAQSDAASRFWLEFDGVFRNSIVALNGIYLGQHASGYTPFRYDITDFVNYGGKNVLVVRVDATLGEGWWYEGAGIYRHVWLSRMNPVHVVHDGTFVYSELKGKIATLNIATDIANDGASSGGLRLVTNILDSSGKIVATVTSDSSEIAPGERHRFEQKVTLQNALLWSLEQPNLYEAVSLVESNGRAVDEYRTTFGIRTIRFDANEGFFLNEKPVKIKGTCNHQDFAGVGVALPDRIHYFRVEKLKQMGANGYRMSHNPPTPALLEACDRLGMLVMDETRMMSSTPDGLAQLETMVRRDRNHPSVIIWSIGNEEDLQTNPVGARIADSMKQLLRRLDPTRPITEAMNEDWGTGLSKVVDVQGFNYHSFKEMDAFHRKFPSQPTIGTETASTVCTRGIYANDKEAGYVSAYDVNVPPWAQLAEYWWPVYAQRPWVAGGFAWTGFDYRGEPTPYSWPCINSHFGIMDMCGFPKDNYYYYQACWTSRPVLHLFPHWNWHGKEGQEIDVWCYSNLDEVELLINGRSLGRKPMPQMSHLEWKVKFAAGVLEARGYKNGQMVLAAKRETSGAPVKLALVADRHTIAADGQDVCILEAQVLDHAGLLVPIADVPIEFHVSGSGRLIGVGNGDPSSHDADKAGRRLTFNGLCAAIVQSSLQQGALRVDATSPGLGSAGLTVGVVALAGNAVY